jgi:hypothetical protein
VQEEMKRSMFRRVRDDLTAAQGADLLYQQVRTTSKISFKIETAVSSHCRRDSCSGRYDSSPRPSDWFRKASAAALVIVPLNVRGALQLMRGRACALLSVLCPQRSRSCLVQVATAPRIPTGQKTGFTSRVHRRVLTRRRFPLSSKAADG